MKTDLITYDLKDRGRKYRGTNRDYQKPENLARLVSVINGGAVQERVKSRDMHGYYGHDIRLLFGLIPKECRLHEGKLICVEPAFATTHLKAYKDGTLEHSAEFHDSDGGDKAWRMYQRKLGGFSSAIDEEKPDFFGFDYVFEPNFTTNRGYSLDSVNDEDAALISEYDKWVSLAFDGVAHYLKERQQEYQQGYAIILDRVSQLEKENADLLDIISKERRKTEKPIIAPKTILDSADDFLSMELDGFDIKPRKPKTTEKEPMTDTDARKAIKHHFGRMGRFFG